jgi:alkanesulfonate monooxygenase SsuD/methylene tetrahydromethanopterin reductase-like flavin-dependent oxidoreductase (luciferase family)
MKVGVALNMLSEPPRPDVAVVSDHLAMGDLAEPLGFDSLFALEHHFTGYAMSPAPLQLLAYYAGRTKPAGGAFSALAGVLRVSNTPGFGSPWRRPGRASRRPRN